MIYNYRHTLTQINHSAFIKLRYHSLSKLPDSWPHGLRPKWFHFTFNYHKYRRRLPSHWQYAAPLAPALACSLSIFDLRWARISTCSYLPLTPSPPPICLAVALYSYWSVHLLASVPEMNTRLNALSGSCCVDSGERQHRLRGIKLKWNGYLKWMWCQSCLRAFQRCGSSMCFTCTPVSKLCNCGVIWPHLLKPVAWL